MKAVLELELIGEDMDQLLRARRNGKRTKQLPMRKEIDLIRFGQKALRPWVARITGLDEKFGFRREFVRFQSKDYSRANSVGSRGVYVYYTLGDGLYEINQRISWGHAHRYFARVENGRIIEIPESEVRACLKNGT